MNYFHFPNIQDPCPFNALPNYKDEYLKLSQTQSHVRQNFINFKSTQRVAHEPSDNLLPKQFSQYKNYFSLNNNNYNDKQLAVSQITSQSLNRSVKNNSKRPVSVDNQLVAQRPIQANLESLKNFNSDEIYKNLQENSYRQMLQSSKQNRNSNLNSYRPEQFSSPQRLNSKKIRESFAQNSPNNQLKQSGDSQNNSKVFISTATTFSKSYTNGFNQTNLNFNNQINSPQNNSYHNLNFNKNVKQNQSYSQNFNQIQTPKHEQTYNPQIASTSAKNQVDNSQSKDKKNMVFRPKRYFQSTNTSPYGQLQKPRYVYTKPSTSYTTKSVSRSQSRKKNTVQSRNLISPTNENIQTNGSVISINNNINQNKNNLNNNSSSEQKKQLQKLKTNQKYNQDSNNGNSTLNSKLNNQTTTYMTKPTKNTQSIQKTYGYQSPFSFKKQKQSLNQRSISISNQPINNTKKIRSLTQSNFSNNLISHNNNILKAMTPSKQTRNSINPNTSNLNSKHFVNKYSYNKNTQIIDKNNIYSTKQNNGKYSKYTVNQYYSQPSQKHNQNNTKKNHQKQITPLSNLKTAKQQKKQINKIINAYDINFRDINIKQQNPHIQNYYNNKNSDQKISQSYKKQQSQNLGNEKLSFSQQLNSLNNKYEDNFDEKDHNKQQLNGQYQLM